MKQRSVGTSGLRVSRLGLGTLGWGSGTDGDDAAAQLSAFAEAGGTLVDTSPAYGDGRAQRVLAELLDDVVPRHELVISSAAGLSSRYGRYHVDCSRRGLLGQLDATLRELGTDYLDLWQVATWDPMTPVDEVAATLDYAVTSGRVRYTGARGYLGWQLATAAGAAGTGRIVATQAEYSLLARGIEDELIPAADHHGIGVLAAIPLAGGVLTGKYRSGIPADSRGADEVHAESVLTYLTDSAVSIVDAAVTAADGLATSPLVVALAWARDRPGVSSAIVGARDLAQLMGALMAEELELPPAIASALDDVSA
ncbi:aldo/keto reductase [Rhodococcus sp. 15-725-2-2b]|jgi:aryl-alcohol dehydrogenase-like predicted oxidoreductase|uniref:aldo/keto reductase n=1 Tax=Nocardiaceae TaxID=85025 RepID=UPI00050BE7C9|nr:MULTISPECIES: aldo/keto reductase [Rhodococcus]OZC60851.1 aldo/keto reductase [Rhodococcus sp. 06-470-2]OZC71555.1 aldo/keto reductase [Rhodococcus sp. 06-469-3-2]OZC83033.1 aldo/keto reductase [Rhodococcus sp. 06-418-5]OZD42344.1 aldo/keto reductase [Rhodococcus sp. 06-1477-1A]OZD77536.1 aldo/keto reductase [Rhodococcus sp. 05-339-2]